MQQALPEPWRAFLAALDRAVPGEVQLHCLGGFVMTTLYGMPRPTADVDVFAVTPWEAIKFLEELRPYLGNPAREDLTLDLWVEAIAERRASRK
jgi:hypothetical protein